MLGAREFEGKLQLDMTWNVNVFNSNPCNSEMMVKM